MTIISAGKAPIWWPGYAAGSGSAGRRGSARHPVVPGVQQIQQAGGQGPLGAVQGHQVNGGHLAVTERNGVADHSFIGGGQFVEARSDQFAAEAAYIHDIAAGLSAWTIEVRATDSRSLNKNPWRNRCYRNGNAMDFLAQRNHNESTVA
jgi:hypothetical protein